MKPRVFLVCAAAEPGEEQLIEVPVELVEGSIVGVGEAWSTIERLVVPRVLRVIVVGGAP